MELLDSGEMKDWLLKIAIPWLWEHHLALFILWVFLFVILLAISALSH